MAEKAPGIKENLDTIFEAFRFLGGLSLILFGIFGVKIPKFFYSLFHTGLILGVTGIVGKIGSNLVSDGK